VGQRFFVLARDKRDITSSAEWWRKIGAKVATLAQLPAADDSLRCWMDKRSANVVVVRPDRYLLAAGASLDEITEATHSLLADPAASNSQDELEEGKSRQVSAYRQNIPG
jgi:hypothetical protein